MNFILDRLADLMWGPGMLALILGTGIYLTIGTRWLPLPACAARFTMRLKNSPVPKGRSPAWQRCVPPLPQRLVPAISRRCHCNCCRWPRCAALDAAFRIFWDGYQICRRLSGGSIPQARPRWALSGRPLPLFGTGHEKTLPCPDLCGLLCCHLPHQHGHHLSNQWHCGRRRRFFDPSRQMVAFQSGDTCITWPVVIAGFLTTLLVGLVLAGGIRRISSVSTILVPFMAGALYTADTLADLPASG